jgi:hypothetical protein
MPEDHTELITAASYEVQTSLAKSSKFQETISVPKENVGAISLLVKEFGLVELLSEC